MYAKLEENHGLSRHAMAVYERATKAIPKAEQYDMFNIYIRRASELFGITHTREIYEKAIEALTDEKSRDICVRYADMETKLGEIDRARGIYSYGSQMCDPRVTAIFWKAWHDFEVKHGNEDTFREMLRIKRSVQAQYNTTVNFMSAQLLANQTNQAAEATNTMKKLEAEAESMRETKDTPLNPDISMKKGVMFVHAETQGGNRGDNTGEDGGDGAANVNPEEIQLDDESEDEDSSEGEGSDEEDEKAEDEEKGEEEEGDEEDIDFKKKKVPDEVFGGLKKTSSSE